MTTEQSGETERLLRRLKGRRALARLALLFERLWPALWPGLGVAGVFLCAALLGLPRLLAPWANVLLLVVACILSLGLLARGLRGLATPDHDAADRRLERASGLRHRPLAILADRPARPGGVADPAQDALWQAHVARVVGQVRRLRVGLPRPGLARLDRRALRGGLVVALVAAFVIAGSDAPARLADAVSPTIPATPAPPGAQLQVWITPPAYTGQAPLFLKPGSPQVAVASGSHVTASLTGGVGDNAPILTLGGQDTAFRALDAASFQGDLDLASGGRLTVRRDGRELAGWDIALQANQAPVVAWTEPPGPAPRSVQTRLPWQATDEYGVTDLRAELRLAARPDAPPIVVTIPVPGGQAKSAKAVSQQDLTANPWAGLPVMARLVARDAAGLSGISADAAFTCRNAISTMPPPARWPPSARGSASTPPTGTRPWRSSIA